MPSFMKRSAWSGKGLSVVNLNRICSFFAAFYAVIADLFFLCLNYS
jgi:hypothetical protein